MTGRRPVPVRDERSAPYWEGTARHQLVLARCVACRRYTHPPDVVCPHCGSTEAAEFAPVAGSGVVRSWTVMRQSFLPGFDDDLPFVLVDVELAEEPGLRMIGRLVDGPGVPLRLGAPVHVAFEDVAPGVAVPAFALERPGGPQR